MNLVAAVLLIIGCSFTSAHASAVKLPNENLQLTHSLFAGILGQYFKSGDAERRPRYLAEKQYLLTVMREWQELLDAGQVTSSQQAFAQMKKRHSYVGRYFYLWEGLYNSQEIIQLGFSNNEMLTAILQSEEFLRIEDRILYILDRTSQLLITGSRDYVLPEVIASSFVTNKNTTIAKKAQAVMAAIPTAKKVVWMSLVRDLVIAGRIGAGTEVTAALQKVIEALRATKNVPALYKGFAASVVVHGAVIGGTAANSKMESASPEQDEITDSLAKLWFGLTVLNEPLMLSDNKDFSSQFKPSRRENYVELLQKSLVKPMANLSYYKLFLQFEKIMGFDERDFNDNLAFDYVLERGRLVRAYMRQQFDGGGALGLEQLEGLRSYLNSNYTKYYRGATQNLIDLMLGWGGNCVTRTLLYVAMLEPYQAQLQAGGLNLAVSVYSDHIEPVIYSERYVYELVGGRKLNRSDVALYRSEFLFFKILEIMKANPADVVGADFYISMPGEKVERQKRGFLSLASFGGLAGSWRSSPTDFVKGRQKEHSGDIPDFLESLYAPISRRIFPSEVGGSAVDSVHEAKLSSIFTQEGGKFSVEFQNLHIEIRPTTHTNASRPLRLTEGMTVQDYRSVIDPNQNLIVVKLYSHGLKDHSNKAKFIIKNCRSAEACMEALLRARIADLKTLAASAQYKRHFDEPSQDLSKLKGVTAAYVREFLDENAAMDVELLYWAKKYQLALFQELFVESEKRFVALDGIFRQIVESPGDFLKNLDINNFSLVDMLWLPGNRPSEIFSRPTSKAASYGNLRWFAKKSLMDYLRGLKPEQVKVPAPIANSRPQLPIVLPKSVHPLGPRGSIAVESPASVAFDPQTRQTFELSSEVLIVLGATLDAGFQLWTEKVVDDFISGRFKRSYLDPSRGGRPSYEYDSLVTIYINTGILDKSSSLHKAGESKPYMRKFLQHLKELHESHAAEQATTRLDGSP